MMKLIPLTLALVATLFVATAAFAEDSDLDKLKKRFKGRYPTLVKLKDAGKIGETRAAMVEVVKAEYAGEKAVGDKTVQAFLAEENKDRAELYALMAKQTETTVELVAARAAKRNYEHAAADHYLKTKADTWVKKRDYRD
jgi:uncharacterized protein